MKKTEQTADIMSCLYYYTCSSALAHVESRVQNLIWWVISFMNKQSKTFISLFRWQKDKCCLFLIYFRKFILRWHWWRDQARGRGLILVFTGALICLWLSLCVGLWKPNYFYVISECSSRVFDYNLVEVNWGKINCIVYCAMNSCCNIFCRNQNALITQCDYECTQMVSQRNKTFQCQSSLLIIGERHLF